MSDCWRIQISALASAAQGDVRVSATGRREGEALGLHWEDIQLGQDAQDQHWFLPLQRAYDPAHRMFNTPKNGRSRCVDRSQEGRATLLDLRATIVLIPPFSRAPRQFLR